MKVIEIDHRTDAFTSYRAERVKSLFNATDEQAGRFQLTAELDIDNPDWRVGLVVGPSGSGKTSIGREILGPDAFYEFGQGWPDDAPIVDAIAPEGDFNAVTAALANVGLGDVPAWLRPYRVLSTGQRFRADLARIVSQAPDRVVIDEFTSVVDRQIAKVGAGAFSKAWKRTSGQAVLLSCHYDIIDWLEPDWIYDTGSRRFIKECHHRRPRLDLEIRQGGWQLWPLFKPHHYLEAGPMPAGVCFVGYIDGEPVVHLGMSSKNKGKTVEARGCRLVVMPEWQGAGVGMKFLNHICDQYLHGQGHLGKPVTTLFHTSHPQLASALRRDKRWRQLSGALYGANRKEAFKSQVSKTQNISAKKRMPGSGGHFRAIQGFRYYGQAGIEAAEREARHG